MLFILYIRSYTFYLEVTDLCWPGHLSKRYRIVICLIFFLLFHSIVFRMLCPVIVRWKQATLAFNMTGLCHVPNLRPFFLSIFWLWLGSNRHGVCVFEMCMCVGRTQSFLAERGPASVVRVGRGADLHFCRGIQRKEPLHVCVERLEICVWYACSMHSQASVRKKFPGCTASKTKQGLFLHSITPF